MNNSKLAPQHNMPDRQALPLYCADDDLGWSPVTRTFPGPGPEWRSLLLDPGSLTQRLIALSRGHFRVSVLDETWSRKQSPALLQCFDSHIASRNMWSRKVVLLGDDEAWVTAHSLIPASSLHGPLKRIGRLQSKPLGAFLFRHPGLRRTQFEIARINNGWARRSVFYLFGKPLLVAEFFLPAVMQAEQARMKRGL